MRKDENGNTVYVDLWPANVNIEDKIFGFVNADPKAKVTYDLPAGEYDIVVNNKAAGTKSLGVISGSKITINKSDVLILIKK